MQTSISRFVLLIIDSSTKMSIREKVTLLSIGTVASVVVALATFLVSVYFGNFVTQASFLKKNGEQDAQIAVIITKMDALKEGQNEIKSMLK